MNITEYDYTQIDNPYNNLMQRGTGEMASEDGSVGNGIAGGGGSSLSETTISGVSSINGSSLTDVWLETWIKSRSYKPGVSGFMIDGRTGNAQFSNITLSGGIFNYGKTSFSDSTNSGYYFSSDGMYIGSAADATSLKYDIGAGTFDFIGTISSRSTATISTAINATGNFIDSNLDTSSKKILSDFTFEDTDYTGAFKTGDITWSSVDGTVTGGSGILINAAGMVGANAGTETFTIDATTGNATFYGTLSGASGTFGTITSGTINGVSLNIPNSTSPLFSVDAEGNVKVKSLARDDFHWFTVFESINGYFTNIDGAGSVSTTDGSGLIVTAEAVTNSKTELRKVTVGGFSWDIDRKFKFYLFDNNDNNFKAYIATGDINPSTNRHIGFYIVNTNIYGSVGDGTFEDLVNLNTSGGNKVLEANYSYADGVATFYIDGIEKGTLDSNIPTGSSKSDFLLNITIENLDGADGTKNISIPWLDFWQANT